MATTADTPSPERTGADPHDRKQPPGLALLFIVEMWERFSYYGMRAILVLYLVNALDWSRADASQLYGTYTSLVYLTPLIGGWLADRLLGTSRSLVWGGVVISLGHIALAFTEANVLPGMGMFYLGLGLIIIGTGLFKPNVSTIVGQLYGEGDPRRDSGFTIFYMGINVGAFLGILIAGYLGENVGWHWGFGAAAVGMIAGLLIYVWGKDRYLGGIGLPPEDRIGLGEVVVKIAMAGVALAAAWFAMAWLVETFEGLGLALITVLLVGGVAGWIMSADMTRDEKERTAVIFISAFFVIFFWAAFEQAGASLTIFADDYTDRTFGGFEAPASWLQVINPLAIILFAPVFAWLWIRLGDRGLEPSTPAKMGFGLLGLSLAFLLLVWAGGKIDDALAAGTMTEADLVSPLFLIGAYLVMTWGELALSPVGLSLVTKLAPVKFASLLMGVWFLANAAANKMAGVLSALMPVAEGAGEVSEAAFASWQNFFLLFVAMSAAAGVIMLVITPWLKRMMHGRG